MPRLTPFAKAFIALIVLGTVGFVMYDRRDEMRARLYTRTAPSVPLKADLPQFPVSSSSSPSAGAAASVDLPGVEPGCVQATEVRLLEMAWNAQAGLNYACGGVQATKGSLMCAMGVNLKIARQDNTDAMQSELVAFAEALHDGQAHPTKGVHFVNIMGDGAPTFLAGLNGQLKKLGPEYTAEIIGAVGRSNGEDALMAPPSWLANPLNARGKVIAGVLRDGDWNIAMKWMRDNSDDSDTDRQLCNNPDEKTYVPNCVNWVAASDFLDAATKYNANYCEDRPVVKNGRATGETAHVCVDAVVTWTPGDVNIAKGRGGLVRIVSTREYSAQMPTTIIGIKKWNHANRSTVVGMLKAALEGGSLVRSNAQARRHATAVNARIFKENVGDWWDRYYLGATEADTQGNQVKLGGSEAFTLLDAARLYGLLPSSKANIYAATYQVFGDIAVQQYPKLLSGYPAIGDVLNTSYIAELVAQAPPESLQATAPVVNTAASNGAVVAHNNWHIHFATGRSDFSPDASHELGELLRELLIMAPDTVVEIAGHTDSVGLAAANKTLSEKRALAVKRWLEDNAGGSIAPSRIRARGYGDTSLIAPNDTETNRAKNRRVEVTVRAQS